MVDGLWFRDRLLPRFVGEPHAVARPIAPPAGAPPARSGAVLVLFYPRADLIHLPLTVRTTSLRNHSGEISFPGGSADPTDRDLIHTALREAGEELAVPSESVAIWTTLTPVWIPVSNFQITPVVGSIDQPPVFVRAEAEVAEVIETPLDLLLQPDVIHSEEREIRGQRMHVPYFAVGAHKVWGATSMILAEIVGKLTAS